MARYDAIADFYDAAVADDATDVGSAALLDLAGEVRGLRLVDLACGQGRITRELARRGATVIGVDVSHGLLTKALAAEQDAPLGTSYVLADISQATTLAGLAFDGVVCNYGLSDIDDLDGALATVVRCSSGPGGSCFRFCTRASRAGMRTRRVAGRARMATFEKAGGEHRTPGSGARWARITEPSRRI